MTKLDPRLHAYRDDLAAAYLHDRVKAPRYVKGEIRQVAAPAAPIRVAPKFDAALATEALGGELLTVYDVKEGWAWVQLREDGYVGYTTLDGLSNMVEENTHRVSARLTYLYQAPDIKRPPITRLSFSVTVAPIGNPEGRFVELSRGGFMFFDHLVGIRERVKDPVRVAERLIGVPYLWGGKTTLGIDCSGLVQISLQAAGVFCLRDTDMQLATPGERLDTSKIDKIQRGDLLFWKGHVAIAQSPDWIIHASAHHMEVVVEQTRHALERIAESQGPLIAILRPSLDQRADADQKPAVLESAAAPAQSPAAQRPAPAAVKGKEEKTVSVKERQNIAPAREKDAAAAGEQGAQQQATPKAAPPEKTPQPTAGPAQGSSPPAAAKEPTEQVHGANQAAPEKTREVAGRPAAAASAEQPGAASKPAPAAKGSPMRP